MALEAKNGSGVKDCNLEFVKKESLNSQSQNVQEVLEVVCIVFVVL